MTAAADRWRHVESVLDAALRARPEDVPALLDRLTDGDQDLRREVESLLAAGAKAPGFLDSSATAFALPFLSDTAVAPPADDLAGIVIGRYRVREEIGHGGGGSVYLAERADGQFEQRVALKLVRHGIDSDEVRERFLRERQILARLEHPNIARLLDGGVSDDGRPYLVMEFIEGQPITEYCDRRRLSIDDRLRLFVRVCRAVQYAHRNLIVHRDLKPTNVLVTDAGEVKLLDFGIATLLADPLGVAGGDTGESGGVLMTPEYASPEQVTLEAATTGSDVYQLGVLLCELLTGRRPHAGRRADRGALLLAIRHDPPALPSQLATAVTPGLRRRLAGDLDAIAAMALRKTPEERYPSAEELAQDTERHLAHLPILAGGEGAAYRARKFARRHRLGVTAAAVVVLLTIGFAAFYTVRIRGERDRARREADKAMEGARMLGSFFQSWDPDASDRGAVSAAQVLADSARRAEAELKDQPETLAATLSILGDLNASLGQTASAERLLVRALEIQERLFSAPSTDLAATLARRGRLHGILGNAPKAEESLRRALGMYRGLLGPAHAETLAVQGNLATVALQPDRPAEAEALSRDIIARSPSPRSPAATEALARLGYFLFLQGRYAEAVTSLRRALVYHRDLFGDAHPATLNTMAYLSSSLRSPAEMPEAEALIRETVRLKRRLYGNDRVETNQNVLGLAVFLERKGDFAEAEQFARETIAGATRIFGEVHVEVAWRLRTLGAIRLARGDTIEAGDLLRRSLAKFQTLFPDSSHPDIGDVLNRLAFIAVAAGTREADRLYGDALAFDRKRPAGPYFVTDGYDYLAAAAHRIGDLAIAEMLYRRALTLYRGELPEGHLYRAAATSGLGAVLLDAGRPDEAAPYLRDGVEQWRRVRPATPARIAEVQALVDRLPRPNR